MLSIYHSKHKVRKLTACSRENTCAYSSSSFFLSLVFCPLLSAGGFGDGRGEAEADRDRELYAHDVARITAEHEH